MTMVVRDKRNRSWMPDKVLKAVLMDILLDVIGLELIADIKVEREKGDEPIDINWNDCTV